MKSYIFYTHGGSKNHGCEAIIRSTCRIIKNIDYDINLYSYSKDEDEAYGVNKCVTSVTEYHHSFKRYSLAHFIHFFCDKILNYKEYNYSYVNKLLLNEIQCDSIYISIGGDNYCYSDYFKEYAYINKNISKYAKTVLWGCSIEPNLLNNQSITEDLSRYSLITARESITYNALIQAGINKSTRLFPDPAFTLPEVKLNLPNYFLEGNTIGINVSPLIQGLEKDNNIVYKNYEELIKYILDSTDSNIALIPHVVWENNNDLQPLTQLYKRFKNTSRVVLIGDHNCMELKGFISRCRMFIGARTHATIAAYSTCVPTLVVGYSVKAKGIAMDIFGSYDNYVTSVQAIKNEDDLIKAFEWLKDNEDSIRSHLREFIPGYIEKAFQAGREVKKLIES